MNKTDEMKWLDANVDASKRLTKQASNYLWRQVVKIMKPMIVKAHHQNTHVLLVVMSMGHTNQKLSLSLSLSLSSEHVSSSLY